MVSSKEYKEYKKSTERVRDKLIIYNNMAHHADYKELICQHCGNIFYLRGKEASSFFCSTDCESSHVDTNLYSKY